MILILSMVNDTTVPTVDSCTKSVDIPDIKHDRTRDCHPISWSCMDDLTTKRSFDTQATWETAMIGLFFYLLYMDVVQPGTGRHPVLYLYTDIDFLCVIPE